MTVAAENGHVVAFLGTSDGRILKVLPPAERFLERPVRHAAPCSHGLPWCSQVYLAPDGTSAEYGSILVDINKKIKQDLALSGNLSSLYAMTHDKVSLKMASEGRFETSLEDMLGLALDSWTESGLMSLESS